MATPKFLQNSNNFQQELKRRVNEYFEQKKKSATGNFNLYFKAGLFVSAYIALYVHLVYFTPATWLAIIECIMLGGVAAAIGFNVMHDGGHGSFSKSKTWNKLAAVSANFMGVSHIMWAMKHNIIHHTYTNIDGVDDDIEIKPYLRMCATQKRRKIHRFQHYYVWILYCLLHILWIFLFDYQKYFSKKIGSVAIKKMTIREHIAFWAAKVLYAFVFIALPIYMLGFLKFAVGFIIATFFTGFVISVVFQLAHTVEETEFPMPVGDTNKIENEWAIHQVQTTANFATKNKLISWLVGGLNFQIEHHLFPKISHVHYPAISKIIRETCNDFNIKYIEFPKMRSAIASHTSLLRRMGRVA